MWLLYTILGAALWSLSDVANSIIIHRYERNALVIAWFASLFDIVSRLLPTRFVENPHVLEMRFL